MQHLPKHLRHLALALTLPVALLACGDDDPTGLEGSGTVTAEVHDDPGASQASQAGTAPAAAQSAASGTMSGSAQAFIFSETQGWVAVGSASSTSLAMQSAGTAAVGSATVGADSYTRVRLVLDGFNAQVDAGSALGGVTLDASVSITMGGADGTVTIEKEITPFTVSTDASANVSFDLNSEMWVDQESAESGSATDAEIQSATTAIATAG